MMPTDVLLSALAFALVTAFTPGPNNAMLLASGVNFGFARTLPHISGITIGYVVMFAAVALGLGRIFAIEPLLYDALRYCSAVYMLWLAWRIATAARPSDASGTGRPLSFLEAALFQWVNPKGVAVALAASANFVRPDHLTSDLSVMSVLVLAVSLASAATWAAFGQGLRGWLENEQRRTWFNRVMAIALIASLWPLFANHAPAR